MNKDSEEIDRWTTNAVIVLITMSMLGLFGVWAYHKVERMQAEPLGNRPISTLTKDKPLAVAEHKWCLTLHQVERDTTRCKLAAMMATSE